MRMALSFALLLCLPFPAGAESDTVVARLDRSQQNREAKLMGYTVTEHYTLRNSRFDQPAEMTVETTYAKDRGKTYRIVSRTGPSLLQTRVLTPLLKEEERLSMGEERKLALVTSANYEMRVTGQETVNGRLCDVVELLPRIKNSHLLKGNAWVDAESHTLVRIAGKPPVSPSFFAGHPAITRDYAESGGFSFAQSSRALTDSFLLGKSELTIEYRNYVVNQGS